MQTQVEHETADGLLVDFDRVSNPEFDAIYHRHRDALVRYARRRKAVDPEGVADLALFDGYRAIDSLRHKTERIFWSYLYRAVNSHIAQEYKKPIPTPMELAEHGSEATEFESDVVSALDLNSLIEDLAPDQRAVMRLRFIDGLSTDQTARELSKTPNAVRQLQYRGVRRLRRILVPIMVLAIVAAGWALSRQSESGQLVNNAPADGTGVPAIVDNGSDEDPADGELDDGEPSGVVGSPSNSRSTSPTSPDTAAELGSTRPANPATSASPTTSVDDDRSTESSTTAPTPTTVPGDSTTVPAPTTSTEPPPSSTTPSTQATTVPTTTPLSGDVIVLRAAHSGKCLEVPGGATTNGLTISQAPCSGADHQRYRLIDAGGGYVQLAAIHSNKCLHVKFASGVADTEIIHDPCTGSTNAQFLFDAESASSQIRIRNTGMCFDVAGASTADGASLLQSICHTGSNQLFAWS